MNPQPETMKYYLKKYYLFILTWKKSRPAQCNQSMDVVNFQKFKTPRKDGTIKYGTWCVLCKANYNNDYMKRRREDPAFREKEKAYLEKWKNR